MCSTRRRRTCLWGRISLRIHLVVLSVVVEVPAESVGRMTNATTLLSDGSLTPWRGDTMLTVYAACGSFGIGMGESCDGLERLDCRVHHGEIGATTYEKVCQSG